MNWSDITAVLKDITALLTAATGTVYAAVKLWEALKSKKSEKQDG